MTNNPTTDFDGCHRKCRIEQRHSLEYGGCEQASPPEPTVSISKIYTDPADGYPSIGFDTYTVPELARLIEGAAGDPLRAAAVARTIVHRNDDASASVVPVPPATAATEGAAPEPVCRDDAGCHSVVPCDPGCGAVDLLAVATRPLPPSADRAAVLREVADWLKVWRPEFFERWAVAEQDRYEDGVDDAATELRRLAAEAPQPEPAAGVRPESCAHCGKNLRRITGTLTAWWVHVPGGQALCSPWQPARSTRATPQPAAGAGQDGAQT